MWHAVFSGNIPTEAKLRTNNTSMPPHQTTQYSPTKPTQQDSCHTLSRLPKESCRGKGMAQRSQVAPIFQA